MYQEQKQQKFFHFRIQSMKSSFNHETGKPEYKGAMDVIVKVIRNEGFFSLWKGKHDFQKGIVNKQLPKNANLWERGK